MVVEGEEGKTEVGVGWATAALAQTHPSTSLFPPSYLVALVTPPVTNYAGSQARLRTCYDPPAALIMPA